MKAEFYDITFRKKLYSSLEQLQRDVDEWLKKYNEFRPHSGKYCYGKTPLQTFLDSKYLSQEHQLDTLYDKSQKENSIASCKDLAESQKHHEAKLAEHMQF